MPDISFALIGALLWAVSAPVVNAGLERMPEEGRRESILVGLLAALISGSLLLAFLQPTPFRELNVSPMIVMAGVFTFPLATGLYYMAARAFGARTELASQFAKVKPVFSVLFAIVFIGETLSTISWVAFGIILMGIGIFSLGAVRGHFSWGAFWMGLGTALAWALGELFVKLGFGQGLALEGTFIALSSSTLLFGLCLLPFISRLKIGKEDLRWIVPFLVHGVLSFGIGYAFFFKSIILIGLVDTILVTSFWPALALLSSCAVKRIQGKPCPIDATTYLAVSFLLCGSILKALTL